MIVFVESKYQLIDLILDLRDFKFACNLKLVLRESISMSMNFLPNWLDLDLREFSYFEIRCCSNNCF